MRIKLTRQLGHSPRGTLPLAVELDPDAAAGFVHGLIPDNGGRCKQGRGDARGPVGEVRRRGRGGAAGETLKRPLIREDLNVIQTSVPGG